jgi:hypothetical protein
VEVEVDLMIESTIGVVMATAVHSHKKVLLSRLEMYLK